MVATSAGMSTPEMEVPVTTANLTDAMAKALLRKHLTGDVGEHRWAPIAKLLQLGYLADQHPHLIVTAKGKAWCDAHHMEYVI